MQEGSRVVLFYNFPSPKTVNGVVVDHACRLHVCITGGGAQKFKASLLEVFA
jgi:hypothetical protein